MGKSKRVKRLKYPPTPPDEVARREFLQKIRSREWMSGALPITETTVSCNLVGKSSTFIHPSSVNDLAVSVSLKIGRGEEFAEKAKTCAENLHRHNHPCIGRHRVTKFEEGVVVSLFESSDTSFEEWARTPSLKIWDYHIDDCGQMRLLGMGPDFVSFFKGVSRGLRYLICKGEAHGNLYQGARISSSGAVMLSHMSIETRSLDAHSLKKVLKNDISDLKKMVEFVIRLHPRENNLPRPSVLKLFFKLCFKVLCMEGNDIWNQAYFVVANPLFFEGADRYRCFFSMWDIACMSIDYVFERTKLYQTPDEMNEYYTGHPLCKQLDKVLHFKNYYDRFHTLPSGGFFYFIKHCYWHARDYASSLWTFLTTEAELYKSMPDLIPRLFFEFTKLSYDSISIFKENLAHRIEDWTASTERMQESIVQLAGGNNGNGVQEVPNASEEEGTLEKPAGGNNGNSVQEVPVASEEEGKLGKPAGGESGKGIEDAFMSSKEDDFGKHGAVMEKKRKRREGDEKISRRRID